VTVLGAEELVGKCDGARSEWRRARVALEVVELLHEREVGLSCLDESSLELLIPVLQELDLLSLALAGRLCRPSVTQDALDAALLFLVFRLGPFPAAG
jgi:hypothetical protein